jgi:P-type conjugative transfer protein TrbJ
MLKKITTGLILSGWLLCSPFSLASMPVIDATAIAKLVEELNEMKRQTDKLNSQIQSLSGYAWSNDDALDLMNDLSAQMNQYSHIAYSAQNLDAQFAKYFPGYVAPENYQAQYESNINDTLRTFNGALQTIGLNTNNFSSEKARLDAIHSHVQSAEGQTQAVQAMTEVSEELVTQTQSLRQIVSAQANAQTAYYAQAVQQEASAKATQSEVIKAGSTTPIEYGSIPENQLNSPYPY